jgi:hypothetical protein
MARRGYLDDPRVLALAIATHEVEQPAHGMPNSGSVADPVLHEEHLPFKLPSHRHLQPPHMHVSFTTHLPCELLSLSV